MAKAATDEQVQLRRRARRRLIGAIALVTLIAVVLPWLLEGEPRRSDQEIAIQIPSTDSGPFGSRALPGKEPRSGKPAPAPEASSPAQAESVARTAPGETGALQAEQENVLAPPVAQSAPAKEKPPVAKDVKAPPEARKKAAEKSDPIPEGKQFVVQIAALADVAKVESVQQALAAKGIKSYTEVVKTSTGEVTRVRIGPFASREAAEQERARLKALGYDGNVAPR